MHRPRYLLSLWDELSFTLKPGTSLTAVAYAFNKFYGECYGPYDPSAEAHIFPSDGSVLLHADSGGIPLDRVEMSLTESDTGQCNAKFCSSSLRPESTEKGYTQVKRFFTERAADLLNVESWGEQEEQEQGEEKRSRRNRFVCQRCGSRAYRRDASFCWKCGEKIVGAEAPGSMPVATEAASHGVKGEPNLRTCIVCHLGFLHGDLLAWCPFCMAAAHRVHLLEYLHVHGNCPACGHQLEEKDLRRQLRGARLRLPSAPKHQD